MESTSVIHLAQSRNYPTRCDLRLRTHKAEETLLRSLEVDTNGMLTHFNLGILYQTEGKFNEAIDSFQKSLNINPFYTEAYYQLATTHLKINNKESAKQSLEKGLQADPNNLKFQKLYNEVLAS